MALKDSLISLWELDESSGTRVDAHGSNDLTQNGTGGVGSGTGVISNAADFEVGDSDYLNITDASQTGLDFTSDFSFACWVKLESQHDGAFMYKWGGSQAAYGFGYFNISSTYKLRFNGYATGGGSNVPFDIAQTLTSGTWYHVGFAFDALGHASGDGTVEMFVNGSSIGTVTNGSYTGSSNTTGAFSLSSLGSGIQWYYDGLMDQAVAWNRLVTAAEFSEIYNSGSGLAYTSWDAAGASFTPKVLIY